MFASGKSASVSAVANYIEDVFSTYLYTGNGTSQTITNGIDLSTKGGLVWVKSRSDATENLLYDTTRGVYNYLISSTTSAQSNGSPTGVSSFNTTGFGVAGTTIGGGVNGSAVTYASWTFRKQPKFFDVVTYTGDGINRTIAHNLGSVPGCIIVKKTSGADNWFVQHRSLGATKYIALNDADIAYTNSQLWNNTEPTSTVFTLGTNSGVNQSDATYVAYLFAHDAGGFGLTGSDNVISCGSYSGNGGNNTITLGYEPQWLMVKEITVGDANSYWAINDNMRNGITANGNVLQLQANSSSAEDALGGVTTGPRATATGFQYVAGTLAAYNASGSNYIYIAIRRGPMKVPTVGTSVFSPISVPTSNALVTGNPLATGFPVDLTIATQRTKVAISSTSVADRLRGTTQTSFPRLTTNGTGQEAAQPAGMNLANNTGATDYYYIEAVGQANATDLIYWNFKRAPSFFDEVCYTGTGSATTVTHNLTVAPEMMIVKKRSAAGTDWNVYHSALGNTQVVFLDLTNATATATRWNDTTPTAAVFSIGSHTQVNESGATFVWYGFATCAGVSKVGSYSGSTGNTVVVPCGFTSGVRFVLIKRTDSTGDWYVWDSARGIISGNDPYLLLNSTAAEVTSTDYIDTYSAGFEVTSTAPAALNATGGTYIFLAIA
jgi:hypothetical protein